MVTKQNAPKSNKPNKREPRVKEALPRFINRELSWLAFNERVLCEAHNKEYPLFERVRFLSISAKNLEEFYMVRVAGLKAQVNAGINTLSKEGLTPQQQLKAINEYAAKLIHMQEHCWRDMLSELCENGIEVTPKECLNEEEIDYLKQYFFEYIFPLLTPIAVDPGHPFPFIPNLGFALALELEQPKAHEHLFGLLPVPGYLSRFIEIPQEVRSKKKYILIEEVLALFIEDIFTDFRVLGQGSFRLLRDSDLEIDDEAEDLVRSYETALKRRRRGSVIRLKVHQAMPAHIIDFIIDEFEVEDSYVFSIDGLVGFSDIDQLIDNERPELLFSPYHVRYPERIRDFGGDCFAAIRNKDFIVHHPYESFDVVVKFIQQAARDPNVLSIKQTLYRTSQDSPIVKALIEAAESGKSVTAIVELGARFDEEANIRQARDLERAGAHVVYGFKKLKTHAKVSLIVRREGKTLKSYVHYGTGNYHPITAKIYTDLSLFSCDEALCRDTALFFNLITGYATPKNLRKIAVSPLNMRARLQQLIMNEITHAENGAQGRIWAKMNALVDEDMIELLYLASQKGVQIDLVVRGICCLRPGVKGLSENIRVKSIVGRFLEHARILCFGNGYGLPSKNAKIFISSADWMPRNLDRRIETLIPIENETVHQQILDQIMRSNLKDKKQSWVLQEGGEYVKMAAKPDDFSAHEFFMTNPSLSGRGKAKNKYNA